MSRPARRFVLLLLVASLLVPARAVAQDQGFQLVRGEEDWTWLAEPEAETDHAAPGLKHVELGSGWSLGVGGEWRVRTHRDENRALDGTSPRVNTFTLVRTMLHADVRHEDGARVFAELLDARLSGNERPEGGGDIQNADLSTGFLEYASGGTTVRAGRFEMPFGNQRFIEAGNWNNSRRRFEGLLVRRETDGARVDLFATHPLRTDPRATDRADGSQTFSGAYSTVDVTDDASLDLYALAYNESSRTVTDGGRTGGFDIYTLGLRPFGKTLNTDWEVELTHQKGRYAGAHLRAWSLVLNGGLRAPDLAGEPRFGLDLSLATGDEDPTDGTRGTFHQLFPAGHMHLGIEDVIGRQNIIQVSPNVTVQVDERTRVRLAWHRYWLHEARDALYGTNGGPRFQDPTGAAGRDVGSEFDLLIDHRFEALAPHGGLQLGATLFEPGSFVETLGSNDRAKRVWLAFLVVF